MTEGVAGGGHAVVVGGSVAGLLAAWALARHVRAVTILDRDEPPDAATAARKGVPQGRHAHAFLAGGRDALDELFAGAAAFDLGAAGAVPTDAARDVKWFHFGVWKKRFESGLPAHWCDRPRLEHSLRRRVVDLENVRLLPGRRVTGLVADGARVVGVRAAEPGGGEAELRADLVVDASGGGSRTPRWLEELGYPRVREDTIRVDVGYASRVYGRSSAPPSRHDWTTLVIYPRPPDSRRAGVVYPLGGGRWLVTLMGWVGDHPPADDAGFLEFARSLPVDDLHDWLRGAEPLSEVRRHNFPAGRWRRFERMARWPEGFVAVGDAVCAFNPVYGQGMTVSALDAAALDRALGRGRAAGGGARAPGFARRLQRELAGHRTNPWLLAAASDFRFPEVQGRRPVGLGFLNRYTQGVLELSGESAAVHLRFIRVIGFRAPPAALFHPAVALRVLRWALTSRAPRASAGAGPGRPGDRAPAP